MKVNYKVIIFYFILVAAGLVSFQASQMLTAEFRNQRYKRGFEQGGELIEYLLPPCTVVFEGRTFYEKDCIDSGIDWLFGKKEEPNHEG